MVASKDFTFAPDPGNPQEIAVKVFRDDQKLIVIVHPAGFTMGAKATDGQKALMAQAIEIIKQAVPQALDDVPLFKDEKAGIKKIADTQGGMVPFIQSLPAGVGGEGLTFWLAKDDKTLDNWHWNLSKPPQGTAPTTLLAALRDLMQSAVKRYMHAQLPPAIDADAVNRALDALKNAFSELKYDLVESPRFQLSNSTINKGVTPETIVRELEILKTVDASQWPVQNAVQLTGVLRVLSEDPGVRKDTRVLESIGAAGREIENIMKAIGKYGQYKADKGTATPGLISP